MDFAQAAELPIVEMVCGTEITFPLLNIEDYIPWAAELKAHRKTKSKPLIPKTADAMDQFRIARMIEFDEVTLEDIARLIWTPEGAKRVLKISLKKAGTSDADQSEIIKGMLGHRMTAVARDVCGLFLKEPEPLPKNGKLPKGDSDPNDETAQNPSADNEETGS